jgi:6-phosphogluconate dehydrogenase (decarboxylating)
MMHMPSREAFGRVVEGDGSATGIARRNFPHPIVEKEALPRVPSQQSNIFSDKVRDAMRDSFVRTLFPSFAPNHKTMHSKRASLH